MADKLVFKAMLRTTSGAWAFFRDEDVTLVKAVHTEKGPMLVVILRDVEKEVWAHDTPTNRNVLHLPPKPKDEKAAL